MGLLDQLFLNCFTIFVQYSTGTYAPAQLLQSRLLGDPELVRLLGRALVTPSDQNKVTAAAAKCIIETRGVFMILFREGPQLFK